MTQEKTPEKLTIACDFDGVLVHTLSLWMDALYQRYPDLKPIPIHDYQEWNLNEAVGLNEAEMWDLFGHVRAGKENGVGVSYKQGVATDSNIKHWIDQIKKDGHTIFVLTHNPETVRPKVEHFLKQWGIEMPVHFVHNPSEKKKWMKDADILIEDNPGQASTLDWDNTDKHLIIYNTPYNAHIKNQAYTNIHRAYNWANVYDHVTEIAMEKSN